MSDLTWFARPAWWVPVDVVFETSGLEQLDPLELAVRDLIRAGIRTPRAIAQRLQLEDGLVVSACGTLQSRALVSSDDHGSYTVPEEPPEVQTPELSTRRGWIVWDVARERFLSELWLEDRSVEHSDLEVARSTWIERGEPSVGSLPRPKRDQVTEALGWLPHAGALSIVRTCGADVVVEGGLSSIRQLMPCDERPVAGDLWVPTEIRMSGVVVWKPSIFPLRRVNTQLDPDGFEGLRSLLTDSQRLHVRRTEDELALDRAPFLLEECGFESLDELRAAARRRTQRELGSTWARIPKGVLDAADQAMITETVSRAARADWRAISQGWADVLDVATHVALEKVSDHVLLVTSAPGRARVDAARAVLGPSHDHLVRVVGSKGEWNKLRSLVENDRATLGTRILALGAAVALSAEVRARLAGAPPFTVLNRAVRQRNLVVHRQDEEARVDPLAFRADVLESVRGLVPLMEV